MARDVGTQLEVFLTAGYFGQIDFAPVGSVYAWPASSHNITSPLAVDLKRTLAWAQTFVFPGRTDETHLLQLKKSVKLCMYKHGTFQHDDHLQRATPSSPCNNGE